MNTRYEVWNYRTNELVGTYKNRTFARNKVEKLDLEYGAYSYTVKAVIAGDTLSHAERAANTDAEGALGQMRALSAPKRWK